MLDFLNDTSTFQLCNWGRVFVSLTRHIVVTKALIGSDYEHEQISS